MCIDIRSCERLIGMWATYAWTGVCGGLCGLLGVHVDVDPGVRECLCVCVCSLSLHRPLRLPSQVPTPTVLSKPTARRCPHPQLHAPRCSVHQCVLDQEKTKLSGGTPVPGPPSPCPLCCVTRMGAFSPAPSTICCFPGASAPRL